MDTAAAASDDPDAPDETYPWEVGHASEEDRAMGLELELIELQRTRELAEEHGEAVDPIEEEITEVLGELADAVPADDVHEAEIAVPEVSEVLDDQGRDDQDR
jgi:hypothetical protein